MKATPELIRVVVKAIGQIRARNTGIIEHPTLLLNELSVRMLETIAETAIEAIPTTTSNEIS